MLLFHFLSYFFFLILQMFFQYISLFYICIVHLYSSTLYKYNYDYLINEIWFLVLMFWYIKYIQNREYKMYLQNENIAKLWILSIFLTIEGLVWENIKLLCEMKLWDKLRKEVIAWKCSVKKVFLRITQNLLENTCVGVSFLTKLQASGLKLC